MQLILRNVFNLTLRRYIVCPGNFYHFNLRSLTTKVEQPANHVRKFSGMVDLNQTNGMFKGKLDPYNGVTVLSEIENCKIDEFPATLEESLKYWTEMKRRTIWFKVHISHSDWVPILAKNDFKYHHAKDDYVMMYKWLPKDESSNLPPYAHTALGVGGLVINDNNEILVVSEKYHRISQWKLPGGSVDPGENLIDAVIREVLEETNIVTEFDTVISLTHSHKRLFDCSDLYTVIGLKPMTTVITKSDREIFDCKWIDIDEYLNHSGIHDLNKLFVTKYLEYKKKNIRIGFTQREHQLLKKPYTLYHVTNDDS